MAVDVLLTVMACILSDVSLPLRRIGPEGSVIYDFDWFVLDIQILIIPNRKLYVPITYIVLGPQASWPPGGRTACPSLRADLGPCLDQKVLNFDTVALSFLFDKHYPIME